MDLGRIITQTGPVVFYVQLDNGCHQDHLRPRAAEVIEQKSKPSLTDHDLADLFPATDDGSGDHAHLQMNLELNLHHQ